MTLTEFLLARIAEDEAVASEVRPDEYLTLRDRYELRRVERDGYALVGATSGRVLAECEAKRRIVRRYAHLTETAYPDVNRREKSFSHATLCDLAEPYADHPDYRQEWKL